MTSTLISYFHVLNIFEYHYLNLNASYLNSNLHSIALALFGLESINNNLFPEFLRK